MFEMAGRTIRCCWPPLNVKPFSPSLEKDADVSRGSEDKGEKRRSPGVLALGQLGQVPLQTAGRHDAGKAGRVVRLVEQNILPQSAGEDERSLGSVGALQGRRRTHSSVHPHGARERGRARKRRLATHLSRADGERAVLQDGL